MGDPSLIVGLTVGGVAVALAALLLLATGIAGHGTGAAAGESVPRCPVLGEDRSPCGQPARHLDPFRGERICEEHFGHLLGRVGLAGLMDADMRFASARAYRERDAIDGGR
ncbi:MAG: hypothetical protein JOZ41_18885 [Chloroflexi bacterium]|nr:hypothetical protein [Chloroflexota bacterium]